MKGSLQLKRGVWQAVIYYQDESGKHKQKWVSTGLTERGNKKAAKEILERELIKFEQQFNESKDRIERRSKPKEIDKSEITKPFGDYIIKYVESIKEKLSPEVYKNYRLHYCEKIKAYFDKLKFRLIDITTDDIVDFYEHLKGNGLSNSSLKHYSNVLRPALKQAFKDKLIPDNPYDFMPTIKREKAVMGFYDKNEMQVFFETLNNKMTDPAFRLAYKIAAYYGLLRSELLGLRWSSIDFEHKTIFVNHKVLVVGKKVYLSDEMKTKTSNRTLPLIPAMETELLNLKKAIEENKTFYGNSYNNDYNQYVFVKENGNLIYPNHLTHKFIHFLRDNGLKQIRLHDLRHSCASIMLANGIQMKQIQEWLGHASFSTTADVYSHLDFSTKLQSASAIAGALSTQPSPEIIKEIISEPEPEQPSFLQKVFAEMYKLGFTDYNEYFAYLEAKIQRQAEVQPKAKQKSKEDDMCM